MDADKTEFMFFEQVVVIPTLRDKPLKLIDQSKYLSNNIPSSESDIKVCMRNACTAIDRLSIIWKSVLSDRRKQDYF